MKIQNKMTIQYDGLVLTSIDYEEAATVERPNRIIFSGKTIGNEAKALEGEKLAEHGATPVDNAVFLKKVKHIDGKDEDGERIFEADMLDTVEEAEEYFYNPDYLKEGETVDADCKPLFVIHGFNNEPGYHLTECKEADEKFNSKKVKIIPVIWSSKEFFTNYSRDRKTKAPEAAAEFKKTFAGVIENMDVFVNKSLLVHGLGNYVFRLAATENVKFDNIFMSAADVQFNLFHEDYINSGSGNEKDGLKIFKMLTIDDGEPKGRIYCMYNESDYALGISEWKNGIDRLGQVGNAYASSGYNESLTYPDMKDYIKNFNCYDELTWDTCKSHSYHFKQFAIDYIEKRIDGIVDSD